MGELIAELIVAILRPIIAAILEFSFEIGFFVFDFLSWKEEKADKTSFSFLKKVLISLLGFLITVVLTVLIIFILLKI